VQVNDNIKKLNADTYNIELSLFHYMIIKQLITFLRISKKNQYKYFFNVDITLSENVHEKQKKQVWRHIAIIVMYCWSARSFAAYSWLWACYMVSLLMFNNQTIEDLHSQSTKNMYLTMKHVTLQW
jgi:uncharacterized CHY-type Zn-finger protein